MNQCVNITQKIVLIIVLSCFVAYAAFAQDTIEKINCSGVLQEEGQLITGTKDLTFSIEDTEWEQTIPEVQIQNGIYSVKLDAPPSVFWTLYSAKKQANLEISINGTPLTPTTTMLWVPYAYLAINSLQIAGNPVSGTPQTNYVLKWNGTEWEPAADSGIITESDPVWSKASSNYYNITDLTSPGNAQIHWNNLNNVPEDIKDGDNVGITSLSDHKATELNDIQSSGSGSIITTEERNKLGGIEANADKTDAQNVASAGAVMDGDFSSNGIMKRTGSGSYGVLDANSGRSFLGLGSAATRNVEDTLTNGSNVPDGAAIVNYVSNKIPETSNFVNVSSEQAINAAKTFNAQTFFNNSVQIGNSSDGSSLKIYSNSEAIYFKREDGVSYGEIDSNSNYDFILNNPRSGGNIRTYDDLYLQGSSTSTWKDLYCGDVRAHDYIGFYKDSSLLGKFAISASNIYFYSSSDSDFQIRTNLHVAGNNNDQYMSFGSTTSQYITFSEGEYRSDLDINLSNGEGTLKVKGYIETTQSEAYKPGSSSWTSPSDIRLKDIKTDFNRGLEAIKMITPKVYEYKKDNALGLPSGKQFVGGIAQNIQEAIPEAIKIIKNNENNFLSVDTDPIFWAMLNSIKQLSDQNDDLKTENETLKQELSQIKQMIAKIQQSLEITQ